MFAALNRYKIPLLVVALVVIGFIAYTYLFGGASPRDLLVSESSDLAASGAEQELLTLLLELRSLELPGHVFDDPSYRTLEDFSQELTPLPVGRSNPFAPY